MPKSVHAWCPRCRAVPGASRRQQYSASTKRALVDVAEELFTEHGYANTSLDAIVAGARVTKGALYHHFSGKQALFEAVFERVETDASKAINKALKGKRDPWEKAQAGLRAFLEVVQEPRYRRIVIQEGPGGPRLRAVPRAGGALDVRHRPRHRPLGARRRLRGSSTRRCCRPSRGSSSARCPRRASPSPPPTTRGRRGAGRGRDRLHHRRLPGPGRLRRRLPDAARTRTTRE